MMKKILSRRIQITGRVVIMIVFAYFFSLTSVNARSINFSNIENWSSGTTSNTRTVKSGLGVELDQAGSWNVLTWRTPDNPLSAGAAFTTDGTDIFVARGAADVLFWRYSPSKDSWTTLKNLPRGAYFGSDIQYVNGYIYAVFGGYQNTFARYSVANDSWQLLSNYPDLAYQGASMTTDGTNIYAIAGNTTQGFYKYTVSSNSWSILASTPATMRSGADLEKIGDYIYAPRGSNTNTFYAYHIPTNTWSTLSNLPGLLNDDVEMTVVNGNIYLAPQNGGVAFYKYTVSTNTWSTLTNAPLASRYGGLQYVSSEGHIYFFRANGDYRFWKYDPLQDKFLGPTDAPATLSTGSDTFNYNNIIYVTRGGNTNTFYSYDPSTNFWTTLNVVPFNLADDTRGTLANGYIYLFQGNGQRTFARYNISTGIWESLAITPAIVRYGAALAYPGTGDYLFATAGANTSLFWKYDIVNNTWGTVSNLPTEVYANYGSTLLSDGTDIYFTGSLGVKRMFKYTILLDKWEELGPIPFSPYYGTDTTYSSNGRILALAGNYETDLWEYNISTAKWRYLGNYAGYGPTDIGSWQGASIVSFGTGNFFITRGGGRVENLIFSYGASDYKSYGVWTSPVQDLKNVVSWDSINVQVQTPSNTSYIVETRTSSDSISWSSWEEVVSGNIVSDEKRFLQIKITLNSSSDGHDTPILNNIKVEYTSETNPPSIPSNLIAMSQEVGGTQLTSEAKYSFINPSFSWNPSIDSETNISGYYVYFGPNINANPVDLGSFQTGETYLVNNSIEVGLNYLRIVAEDVLGNRSNPSTLFIYDYNGVAPMAPLEISTTDMTGNFTNSNLTIDGIKLKNVNGGFWLQNRLTYPTVSFGYGSKNVAYIEDTNKLYIALGTNSNRFFVYSIDTDIWTELAPFPAAVYFGGGVVEGPDGNLYGFRGNNTTEFWRYNIANNTWYTDVSAVPLAISYGGSMVFDHQQYIYVLRGNSSDNFWRYNTFLDVWESLDKADFGAPQTNINNNAYMGASLAIDIGNGLIYATQGNYSNAFSVYNINTNQWTLLGELPALPYLGASLAYYPTTDSIIFQPGNGFPNMYSYSVSNKGWTQLQSAPSGFNHGAGLYPIGKYMYVIRGGGSNLFYKYNIEKDSWEIPKRGLFGREYQGNSLLNLGYGADIIKGDGNNFYLARGNYGDNFIRWNEKTGQLTTLSDIPIGIYVGGSMVYDSTQNKIYLSGGANNRAFFVYDIQTNIWSEETNDKTPLPLSTGSSMVYDGSRYIYVTRAGGTNTFYKFDTQASSGSKWSTAPIISNTLNYGSELLVNNGNIYTLRGSNVNPNQFYQFNIQGGTWSPLTSLNSAVYNDSFLVDGNDGYFYTSRASNTSEFYRYSLSSNSWSTLPNFPGQIYNGGAGESNMKDSIYVLAGAGANTYQDAIYTYIQETEDSGFVKEGLYLSQVHDLTSVYKWGSLVVSYDDNENTQVIIETSSSVDNVNWSDWAQVSREKITEGSYKYKINSPIGRYIKVRFTLLSGDGINTPVISGYSINYYQDIHKPSNPNLSGFVSMSQQELGTSITTNNWYSYSSPYFTWAEKETEFGSTDGINGSGVVGYNVYWGTNPNADPAELGQFQTTNSYLANSLSDGSTYYLRIRTVDDAGNFSEEVWQPYIYKFDITPPQVVANVSVDPAGYTSTNNFSFDWEPSTTSGAPITEYCFKTGVSEGEYSTDQCIEQTEVEEIPSYKVGTNVFQVRVKDSAGNLSAYLNANYFFVDSENAPAPPTNLTVNPVNSTSNSFAFDWDPPLVGTFYGSVSNLSYLYSVNALPTEYSVSSTSLTYLNAGAYATLPGENIFYVVSKDEAGNVNYSNYSSASFFANTVAPGLPLNVEIADVSVKSTSSWRLAISWDEPSEAGSGVAGYEIFRSIDGKNFFRHSFTSGTSLVDSRLLQRTYYYRVKACDSTNNCGAVSEIVSLFPDGRYIEPAQLIVPPIVTDVTPKKASISWITGRTADSRVAYGPKSGEYYSEEVSNSDQVVDHNLTINNLTPGVQYYYVVKWTDEDGNIGISQEDTFTTTPPPSIQEPVVKRVSLNSALIEFTTKGAVKVRVMYGETSSFGGMVEVYTGTQEGTHNVELNDIKDGTKYYYKLNSFDIDGSEYEGEMHSFETLPRPRISENKVYQVTGTAYTTLLVEWVSNTPISSIVTYFPSSNPDQARDEVNVALKNGKHRAVLLNLLPNTQYSVVITGRDFMGNEASSGVINFTTAVDTRPPQIFDLEVSSEIIGSGENATAQLVASYKTDEPTTAQIEYGEGTGTNYSQKSQEDSIYSNNHIVIISGLTPSKVYHLRAVSKDEESNIGYSIDKVVVTKDSSDNAFDLAINNLVSIFSFLGK